MGGRKHTCRCKLVNASDHFFRTPYSVLILICHAVDKFELDQWLDLVECVLREGSVLRLACRHAPSKTRRGYRGCLAGEALASADSPRAQPLLGAVCIVAAN